MGECGVLGERERERERAGKREWGRECVFLGRERGRRKEKERENEGENVCFLGEKGRERCVVFGGCALNTHTLSLSARAGVCVCARAHTSVRELFFARVRSVSREQVPSLSYISFRFRKVPGKVKFVNLKIHELHLTSHLDLERSLAITHVNY